MKSDKLADALIWFAIAVVGLVAAYVLFGVLKSEASTTSAGYSVGGAAAGAIVAWGVLTSVYLQLRGSSDELRELRERSKELENKLIRSAPRPLGFEIEVDERQRIVLARPREWTPQGGMIIQMEAPPASMRADDDFAAKFNCSYVPIEDTTPAAPEYYEKELAGVRDAEAYILGSSSEMVRVGGDSSGVDSLKVTVRQLVRISIRRDNPIKQPERDWRVISREEATGVLSSAMPQLVRIGATSVRIHVSGYWIDKVAKLAINGQPRPTEWLSSTDAVVTLEPEDTAYPGYLKLTLKHPSLDDAVASNDLVIGVVEAEEPDEAEQEEEEEALQPVATATMVPDGSEQEASAAASAAVAASETTDEQIIREVVQEVTRQRVICYHTGLKRIYIFEFWDDARDFRESSVVFNQILSSVRFLD